MKLSNIEINAQGASGLPDNPSDAGFSAEDIKFAIDEPCRELVDKVNNATKALSNAISTNETNIAKSQSDIAKNQSNIAINTTNIQTNSETLLKKTSVKVGGVIQSEVNVDSDIQEQIDNLAYKVGNNQLRIYDVTNQTFEIRLAYHYNCFAFYKGGGGQIVIRINGYDGKYNSDEEVLKIEQVTEIVLSISKESSNHSRFIVTAKNWDGEIKNYSGHFGGSETAKLIFDQCNGALFAVNLYAQEAITLEMNSVITLFEN